MTWTLRIDHADGTTSELSVADGEAATLRISDRLDRAPDTAAEAEVVVFRDAWQSVETSLDVTNDRFYIDAPSGETVFGGRLRDTEAAETTLSVLLDGPKRDALDGEISGPAVGYGPTDDTNIVADLLARTPTLSSGTVEGQRALSFSESNAAPGASLAKLARATGADVLYRPDFTVDYLGRAGSDRTGETLSAAAGTVISEPRVRHDDRETVTHVTVLGAGEGTAQTRATSVVAGYTSGDRRVDKVVRDKDIAREQAAQELADRVVADVEAAPRHLDVELEVPASVAPSLGDTFTVNLPTQNVDSEVLKVMELERLIDAAGDRFRAVLSSREVTREQQGDQSARELDSLSAGNPGQYFALPVSAGFDRVDSGEPLEFTLPYPEDVVKEFRAYIEVDSRAYRLPSTATGHDHSVSIGTTETSASNSDFSSSTEVDNSATTQVDTPEIVATETNPGAQAAIVGTVNVDITNSGGGVGVRLLRDGNQVAARSQLSPDGEFGIRVADWQNPQGSTYELKVVDVGLNNTTTFNYSADLETIGQHDHSVTITDTPTTSSETAVEPGINTQGGKVPTNVGVTVNGTQVGTVGDSPTNDRVDLTGVLNQGTNDIEVTSDDLGELRATVFVEGIKNAVRN